MADFTTKINRIRLLGRGGEGGAEMRGRDEVSAAISPQNFIDIQNYAVGISMKRSGVIRWFEARVTTRIAPNLTSSLLIFRKISKSTTFWNPAESPKSWPNRPNGSEKLLIWPGFWHSPEVFQIHDPDNDHGLTTLSPADCPEKSNLNPPTNRQANER